MPLSWASLWKGTDGGAGTWRVGWGNLGSEDSRDPHRKWSEPTLWVNLQLRTGVEGAPQKSNVQPRLVTLWGWGHLEASVTLATSPNWSWDCDTEREMSLQPGSWRQLGDKWGKKQGLRRWGLGFKFSLWGDIWFLPRWRVTSSWASLLQLKNLNITPSEEQAHWKRPWCQERLVATGEGGGRGWDGWMASLTQQTWISANSGRWWRTGKPGMLQSMGSQRVGHDWATKQQNTWRPRKGESWSKNHGTIWGGALCTEEIPKTVIFYFIYYYYLNMYLFILALPGLSCSMLDPRSLFQHAGSLVVASELLLVAYGI